MSTPLVLSVALMLDAVLGEPRWLWQRLPHPAVLMGQLVAALDQRMNRPTSGRGAGILALLCLVTVAGSTGYALSMLGAVVECVLVAILLAQRSLVDHVAAVATALQTSLEEGRRTVAMIVSRDTAQMDEPAIVRAAYESAAENLSDGVIAPAFWFLIGGLPGILIYKMVNTADSMIGYRTPRYAAFGWAAARFDDLLNWLPARMTAVFIVVAYGRFGDWPAIVADAKRHKSPNAGWPEAAAARALDIALAGPRVYDGKKQDLAWVNAEGRQTVSGTEISSVIKLLWICWAIVLLSVMTITIFCTVSACAD